MADVTFEPVREYGPGRTVPRPVGPGDPRIPPPARDVVNIETGLPLMVSSQVSNKRETSLAKIGIYSSKHDDFVLSVLDDENDPLESVRFSAKDIANKVKPLLEACGHKVVDFSGGDLVSALSGDKVRTLPRNRKDSTPLAEASK